jgi:hypothetical protein
VVVVELTRFGGETEVGDRRDLEVFDLETSGPFALCLVGELEFEGLFGEVGEAGFGGDLGVADAAGLMGISVRISDGHVRGHQESTYRAAGELVGLAVVVLVVSSLTVAVHGHDVRKDGARAVVLVRIEKDTEALEFVGGAKDIALEGALLGEPQRKAIAVQVALAGDLKLYFNLDCVSDASWLLGRKRDVPPNWWPSVARGRRSSRRARACRMRGARTCRCG